jgi:hypothetical protein
MNKRNVVLLFSLFLVLVSQLLGEAGPPIYVSTFTFTGFTLTGGQILSVDGKTGKPTVVYKKDQFFPEDITVGPDNRVYFCDPTNSRIMRMDQDGKNVETVYDQATAPAPQKPMGPQGLRFNAAGALFLNTKGLNPTGVWKIDGLPAIPFGNSGKPFPLPFQLPFSATQSGEGLAFTINGDLLVVNRSSREVQRSPGPDFTSAKAIITGLADPIGIAVNSHGDIFVARGSSPYNIQRFTMTTDGLSSPITYVDFSSTKDRPNYLEFTSDDTLFVATENETQRIGKLWKVTPPSSVAMTTSALVPLATFQGQPAVGVGRPATSVSLTKTFIGTKAYNFGSNSFEVTAGACTATITARERSPNEVNDMLAASGIKGTGQPQSGKEGWITTWAVEPAHCSPADDSYYGIALACFVDEPFKINPGIVRCGSPTSCEQILDFGYYPQGPILGVPGDPISGGKTRSFSEYLFVNLQLAQNGNFCGFLSPLDSDPNNPAVFSIGTTIPVKFQLTTKPGCTGSFITDAKAVLSVAQTELGDGTPTFDRKVVNPSGNANEPPVFRSDGPTKQYIFNLKTSGWTAGLYSATVKSNKFFPQTILFRLQ